MRKSLTGVGAILCASHRDVDTGKLHGHTYEVTAWFTGHKNAVALQGKLCTLLAKIDHSELPYTIAWAEDIAEWVASEFNDTTCVAVDVSRPLERMHARWER